MGGEALARVPWYLQDPNPKAAQQSLSQQVSHSFFLGVTVTAPCPDRAAMPLNMSQGDTGSMPGKGPPQEHL